jgi:hypothetical protein
MDSGSEPEVDEEEFHMPSPLVLGGPTNPDAIQPPDAPNPAKKTARRFKSTKCVLQPTFGDTDDELGVDPTQVPSQPANKKQKKKKEENQETSDSKRLCFASAKTVDKTIQTLLDLDYHVTVYLMNTALANRRFCGAKVADCYEYRGGAQSANFDVDESETSWDPGHDELVGIAHSAYEIADYLIENDRNVAIVLSTRGKDAARLLAACAAQAVRKQAPRAVATSIIGPKAPHTTGLLNNIYQKFPTWSRITAPHEITTL